MAAAHYYQNVLTGQQVAVTSLAEDDFYVENKANWSRIPEASYAEPQPAEEAPVAPVPTIAELRELAAEKSIDLGKATKKADILALITAASEEDEA